MDVSKELLKGHIDTILLALLTDGDKYGYEMAKLVREKSKEQFDLKEGTLYVSLKRLEKNGWVQSYWSRDQGPGGRRKYYTLTHPGERALQKKVAEWKFVEQLMNTILTGGAGI